MEDHKRKLESAVQAIAASLEKLESRVSKIEEALHGATRSIPSRAAVDVDRNGVEAKPAEAVLITQVLSIIGRTFLILAGAFLLRAVTESGVLPQTLGVGLGLAYAVLFIFIADRAGARKSILSATFFGVSAVLVAYPLIWEATTKLEVFSPVAAVAALTLVTVFALWVAWRRNLRLLAAAFTSAALITSLPLIVATGSMEWFCGFLLLLGVITLWFAYGRGWHVMYWITAITADAMVLLMTSLAAQPDDLPERYRDLSIPVALILSVALLVVYLGSFAMGTLARRRDVTFFEVFQTAAALLVGFGGAVRVAYATGSGSIALGAAALIVSTACYAVAFAFVDRRLGRGKNFFFYVWLALVFALAGSWLVADGVVLAVGWSIMAIAAALLGGHFDRITLRAHSAVYVLAATWHAGLIVSAASAFVIPAGEMWQDFSLKGPAVLALTVVCYIVLWATQKDRQISPVKRIPRFVVVLFSVLGCGGLVVVLSVRILAAEGDPALLALVRTAVLALSAMALALGGRRSGLMELTWLVYPVLIAGGAKILFEDLSHGGATTLSLGFVFYGTALIIAPRLRRSEEREKSRNAVSSNGS